jgi:hypothetical protein
LRLAAITCSVSGTGAVAFFAAVLQEAMLKAASTTAGAPQKHFHIFGAYIQNRILEQLFSQLDANFYAV